MMNLIIPFRSFQLNCFIIVLILSELLCLTSQSEIQYMEFFSDEYCASSNGMIWDTNKTLRDTPGFGDALSIKVNGLWEVHEPDIEAPKLTMMWNGDVCNAKQADLGPYSIAERFGDSNLKTSEIAFCTRSKLKGIRFTITATDKELTLPKQIMMLSWFLTGLDEWTVYPNTDFTGKVYCLKPQERVVSDGHGVTYYESDSRLLVGSVRRGCSSATGHSYANSNCLFILTTIVGYGIIYFHFT